MIGAILTRKELYDLVWTEPISKLAIKLGTTDAKLRALCKQFGIPLPQYGHWMKLQHNKPVVIIPLPELENNGEQIVLNSVQNQLGNATTLTPLEMLKNELENDPDLCFEVPDRIPKPDTLIVVAKTFFESKDSFKYDKIQSTHLGIISISVTRPLVVRALRFMDTLIKILKRRGHNVIVKGRDTRSIVFGQEIPIALRETTTRVKRMDGKYPTYDYEPTGMLALKVDENWKGKEFSDGKLLLENKLVEIVAKIELIGREMRDWKEQARLEQIRKDEEERSERRIRELQEKELEKFNKLLNESHRYHQVQQLRTYINDIEATLNEKSDDSKPGLQEWINWARLKADWYDPMIQLNDPLLSEVDRATLQFKKKKSYY